MKNIKNVIVLTAHTGKHIGAYRAPYYKLSGAIIDLAMCNISLLFSIVPLL